MIEGFMRTAAKIARAMFDMGAAGATKEQALNAALQKVPNHPLAFKLKQILREEFKD